MLIIIILAIIFCVIKYIKRSYKELIELREMRNQCLENLERALGQRYDVMEEMIEFSSGFIDGENEFVAKLLQVKLVPTSERLSLEKELVTELNKLIFKINEVPQLKNDQDFTALRLKLAKAEKAISEAKASLNERSKGYNDLISGFPRNIIAKVCKFKKFQVYEVEYITR